MNISPKPEWAKSVAFFVLNQRISDSSPPSSFLMDSWEVLCRPSSGPAPLPSTASTPPGSAKAPGQRGGETLKGSDTVLCGHSRHPPAPHNQSLYIFGFCSMCVCWGDMRVMGDLGAPRPWVHPPFLPSGVLSPSKT